MAGMTGQAKAALLQLYVQAKGESDNFTLERIDRALTEIVRRNSTDPPAWQVRSAMANASKVIKARYDTVSRQSIEARVADAATHGDPEAVVDLLLWLRDTQQLTATEREHLQLLANGYGAADIAERHHVPVTRVRERVSRARRKTRAARDLDLSQL